MRRFSFATTETNDPGVDESLRNLYADSETLEKMCLESITANPMLNSLKVDSNHSRLVDTKFSDNVLEGLSTEYFDPDFDPVEAHLKEISSWDDYGVTEKFMNTISDADTDKDIVLGHLATMIEANYGDLMNCIKNVHQIDVDLSSAGIHINVARRKIKECSSLISRGGMKTITLHKKRERLQTLSETISSLKAVKDVHQAMTKSITTGEVGKAAEYAYEVLQCLKSNSFDRYASLTKIANSASNSILLIRQKADKALKRLCGRKFAASEYDNILTSYLFLDHIAEAMSVDSVDCVEDSGESFYLDSNNCLEGLSQRINRYQLEDIDSCLHTAVVEHIYSTQHRKQKAAAALEVKGAYSTMNFGEIVDLTEIPLNVLYRRITGDSIAPCIIRSCKLLTDVVHTHYLITQWHTSPFDERNEDWKFLHRCAINLSDIEIDRKSVADMMLNFEDEAIDSTNDFDCKTVQSFNLKSELQKRVNTVISAEAKSSLTNAMENNLKVVEDSLSSKSTLVKLVRLHQEKLTDSYQKLAQSRSILWEEMSRSLIDMLNMMTVTSAVKPDDFLALAWALNTMIVIGKEFCGSDSKTLVQILEDKSREYSQHFHFESYNMVRQMLEVEIWQKFPIDLDEAGGIIGLMRTSLAITDKTVEVSEEVDNEELETSILMGFGGKGNPFASMMEKHSDIDCKVRQDQFSKNRVYSSSLIKLLQESIVDSTSKSNDGYIVTQAAINGIIKYVSKYLQLMYIIPTTTLDLFHNLCQLFDYYICSVFYGFVPQDERSRLLSSSTKMNIVAPDQSREYEVRIITEQYCSIMKLIFFYGLFCILGFTDIYG